MIVLYEWVNLKEHLLRPQTHHIVFLCLPLRLYLSTSSRPPPPPTHYRRHMPPAPLNPTHPSLLSSPLLSAPLIALQLIEFCPPQHAPKSLLHANRPQLHWSGDGRGRGWGRGRLMHYHFRGVTICPPFYFFNNLRRQLAWTSLVFLVLLGYAESSQRVYLTNVT